MSTWSLDYSGYDPQQEGLRETLCTLGNGYFATRGAASSETADGIHYPGTYLAGGYNRLSTIIGERRVENEDLVNLPNWLPLNLRIDGGDWLKLAASTAHGYHQSLDLRKGLLERAYVLEDSAGRRTHIRECRLVHMGQPHLAASETSIRAENWKGTLELRSALDGRVSNTGVERYRDLANRHLELIETDVPDADTVFLRTRTVQSRLDIAQAVRTRVFRDDGSRLDTEPRVERVPGCVAQRFEIRLREGEAVTVEKLLALHTGRDRAISEPGLAAVKAARGAPDFETLRVTQALHWEQLWNRFDIGIEERASDATRAARILRLHIFHLLQTTSPNTMDLDVGVPARGWHGEAYRGHVFWDELFIFPLLNWRLPEITRALLMYRYRRLGEARRSARRAGYRGAMFPWQSGSSGREESQRLHLNPRSGHWLADDTYLQRHVNSAVAYNVWQYYQVTGDLEFLSFCGAEMFLEIARFWASFVKFDEGSGRYEIHGVVGPDEFHTRYPGADHPGLDNHGYTNVMAAWVLATAAELLDVLPAERREELRSQLGLTAAELEHWDDASRRMRVVFHDDGVISQFERYATLEELDWEAYRRRYGDIHRLDRILEAEADDVNRYKAAKQADVLMLFYLFSSEELRELFARLGYPFEYETIPRNVAYYAARTSHGSSLSRVVDSWVMARSDREGSWQLFRQALESDVEDVQGGTTREGIHLGAMAGTVDLLQRGYTGIVTRGDELWLNPCLPDALARLTMTVRYRGHTLDIAVDREALRVRARASNATPITCRVIDEKHTLAAGEVHEFATPATAAGARKGATAHE